jgi:RNA polymerase subunit RPABC4/transcription elongation factor Spt4
MSRMSTSDLPTVLMDDGLLLCPACRSMDLSLAAGGATGELVCEACGASSRRGIDQCPQCGAEGMTTVEQVGFSAPGQAPSQAPRKLVRSCQACGYSNG